MKVPRRLSKRNYNKPRVVVMNNLVVDSSGKLKVNHPKFRNVEITGLTIMLRSVAFSSN